ncbi:hypothetical protein D7V94_02455 [Parablautia intestinalis]|uniref:Uncharacterized protein n=1 Tax=Parablautia intestinalis TaxID=2320100 RepID=A0A3A9AQC8_9FIRM|nr:hypothetical protein D7V94_02455 [Parablautia intestinalis]
MRILENCALLIRKIMICSMSVRDTFADMGAAGLRPTGIERNIAKEMVKCKNAGTWRKKIE